MAADDAERGRNEAKRDIKRNVYGQVGSAHVVASKKVLIICCEEWRNREREARRETDIINSCRLSPISAL